MDIYLKALGFIFLAEMGDKTQVLAMVLATKYKLKDVLTGILIGTLLNHGLAIFLGMGLMLLIPIQLIQLFAGILFVVFAFWTLQYESEDAEETKTISRIPMLTVAVLFFVGELGDKTQLTAVTVAMDNNSAWLTLLGTTTGMLITSGIGIALGLKFGSMINEHMIKYCSSAVFLAYGLVKVIGRLENPFMMGSVLLVASLIYGYLFNTYYSLARTDQITAFQKAAASLHGYRERMNETVTIACRGEAKCATCTGKHCSIGYLKYLVRLLHEEEQEPWFHELDAIEVKNHSYVQKKELKEALLITVGRLSKFNEEMQFDTKEEIRKTIETILYGKPVQTEFNSETYVEELKAVDRPLAVKLRRVLQRESE